MDKPHVNTRCVVDQPSSPNEKIVEFSFNDGTGGLISIRRLNDGTVIVEPYRLDKAVKVFAPKEVIISG